MSGSSSNANATVGALRARLAEVEQELAQLHAQNERLHHIVLGIDDGLWDWPDTTSERQWWSPRFFELLGYQHGEMECTRPQFFELMHPDDRVEHINRADHMLKIRGLLESEYRLRTRDGEYRWFRSRARVFQKERGRAFRMAGSVRDVTEEKQTERALREHADQLRNIIEHSTNVFYTHDTDHVLTYLSPQMQDVLGYTPEEAKVRWTGLTTDHPINEAGYAATQRAIDTSDTQPPYILQLRHKSGRSVWVEVHEAPVVVDGRTVAIVGALTDITERQLATDALRESEERFRRVFEDGPAGIALIDPSGRVLSANAAFCSFLGYTDEELLGMAFKEFTHPEDRGGDLELTRRLFAGEIRSYQLEERYLRKDGTVVWGNLVTTLVHDDAGELLYGLGIVVDITQRKAAQEEQHKLEDQLRQVQKMEAVGQLAGGVAHDFNNMLTAVLGNVELLRTTVTPLEADRALFQDGLQQIEDAGLRAADLTRQLLAFSRKQLLQPEVLDLSALVMGMEKMLRRLIQEDIELDIRCAAEAGCIRADHGQIEQVVLNLALNARDAMTAGGRLLIEVAAAELDRKFAARETDTAGGPHLLLTVSDTGVGIPADILERIFEPFFTTKTAGQGTGLGLATVHGIVRQSGGHIVVGSEPGRGSTFRVYWPTVDRDVAAYLTSDIEQLTLHGTEAVLICEDDQAVRDLIVRALDEHGYHVLEAVDARHAIEISKTQVGTIELLVTDVVMPDMDGRELAERLCGQDPSLKVLYVSGYTADAMGARGLLEDGVNFLQKPYSPTTLLQRIRSILDS